jgi:hypothetical protein
MKKIGAAAMFVIITSPPQIDETISGGITTFSYLQSSEEMLIDYKKDSTNREFIFTKKSFREASTARRFRSLTFIERDSACRCLISSEIPTRSA